MNLNISVIIPVYGSGDHLSSLCERITETVSPCCAKFEIVFIDDNGAVSKAWDKIVALQDNNSSVRAFRLARNFGQHNALLAGIRKAQYDLIVTMDDDLQHPPEEIPVLLHALSPDVDVVYGVPKKMTHGIARNTASWITKFVLRKAMNTEIAQDVSAFRIFRRQLRNTFADFNSPIVNIDVMLTWATGRFNAVSVDHNPRQGGQSGYSARKLVGHALKMIIGFSILPLRIASIAGIVFGLIGACLLIFVTAKYLIHGGTVPGFAFLASIIIIFSGVQLFSLGVIGEYMGHVHSRLVGKPSYVFAIDSQTDDSSSDTA